MRNYYLVLVVVLLLFAPQIHAQLSTGSPIYIELKKADSLVFEEGFNKCNIEILQKIMHPDLEFLHDQNGMQNRDDFFRVFKESICSNPGGKPIRKLIEGSLIVYPLKNNGKIYGAIQMGMHEFYMVEPNKEPRYTANGKFIHTWLLVDGQWKLYRVVSYDHRQAHK